MTIIDRVIAGFLRYRKVYFPTEAQLAELVNGLGPFDILRVFWAAAIIDDGVSPIVQRKSKTNAVDLSGGSERIFAGMHSSCRYKVRRAARMGDRFEIQMNTEGARADFLPFYNSFARSKGNIPLLTLRQFNELRPHSDVFMLYFDGQPACGRLVLRDDEAGVALMMYSASRRLDKGADTITIGFLNRYLYWHEMNTYQAAGLHTYDFGGAGDASRTLADFKMSFGGQSKAFHYCFYAGSARVFWKFTHTLFSFQQEHVNWIPRVRQQLASNMRWNLKSRLSPCVWLAALPTILEPRYSAVGQPRAAQ